MKTTYLKQIVFLIILGINGFVNAQKIPLTVNVSSSNTTCDNTNDGSIALTVFGGLPPYTFLWSNGSQSQSINNLSAGFYDVMVRDSYTSMAITVEIRNANVISINGNVTDASAFGANDGGIDVQISGLEGSFDFEWSAANANYINAGSLDQSTLHAGNYTLTVTNEDGCVATGNFLVEQPNPILNPFNPNTNDFVRSELNMKGFIFPNPSTGDVSFKNINGVNSVQIYSQEGFLIKEILNVDGNLETVNLDKGTYNAIVKTIDGYTSSELILVK